MTRTYLRNRFVRLRGRPEQAVDESSWTARDLRTVRRHAPFVAVGSIAMIGLAAVVTVLILGGLAVRTYHGVRGGGLASPWFWDSLVAATVTLPQFAIAAAIAVRDHKRRLIAAVPWRLLCPTFICGSLALGARTAPPQRLVTSPISVSTATGGCEGPTPGPDR
jgi:hypothetical protein